MRITRLNIIYGFLLLQNTFHRISTAPLPAPRPEPLPPGVAQGVIAALTFLHAGIIGYSIKNSVPSAEMGSIIGGLQEDSVPWDNILYFQRAASIVIETFKTWPMPIKPFQMCNRHKIQIDITLCRY